MYTVKERWDERKGALIWIIMLDDEIRVASRDTQYEAVCLADDLNEQTEPLHEELATTQAALESASERIKALEKALNETKEAMKVVIDGLENAPSDSAELTKAQPRFIIESLNLWHATLLSAYEGLPQTKQAPSVDVPKFKVGQAVKVIANIEDMPYGKATIAQIKERRYRLQYGANKQGELWFYENELEAVE